MYCCTATRTTDAVERVCEDIPILKAEYVCCAAGGFFYWERNVDILSVFFFFFFEFGQKQQGEICQ